MRPIEFIAFNTKAMKVYERYCLPVCRKNGLNQTSFDVILFLANNPEYNTARDVCEIRGIRSGMASVAIENLVRSGYLIRQADPHDRRKQRLLLTEKTTEVVEEGRQAQRQFWKGVAQGITQEELVIYGQIADKLGENISRMAQRKRGDQV